MTKRFLVFLIFSAFFSYINISAKEYGESLKKFIRGDIPAKTAAVRQASASEIEELSVRAIDFCAENMEILNSDRELAALAAAGILSLPAEYTQKISEEEKKSLSALLKRLYDDFNDETVKVAVLNKLPSLHIPAESFTSSLNQFMSSTTSGSASNQIILASINTLGYIGNSDSFDILFKCISNDRWKPFYSELQNSLGMLASKSEKQLFELIRAGNTQDCRRLFDFVTKNPKNSQILKAETAENTLSRTIYIYENTGTATAELIALQADSYSLLRELEWTRASKTVMQYFSTAEKEYNTGLIKEQDFTSVIKALSALAPMDCVQVLSTFLIQQNKKLETAPETVSEPVVLSVINTLGAVGDKNAFDSLLAVTYCTYSDSVIAAARSALAKLKW